MRRSNAAGFSFSSRSGERSTTHPDYLRPGCASAITAHRSRCHRVLRTESGRRRKTRRPARRGLALGNLGAAWYALGDAKKAVGYFGEDLAISRELGDLRGEGPAPANLGVAWKALGDPRTAVGFHEEKLAICRELGDRRGQGAALNNLATTWSELNDLPRSIELLG